MDVNPDSPEQKKAWKEFLPPADYEPDWKKQFKAMELEARLNRIAVETFKVAVVASVAALVTPLVPLIAIQVTVGLLVLVALIIKLRSIQNRMKALEIESKLNESVFIEPAEYTPSAEPKQIAGTNKA